MLIYIEHCLPIKQGTADANEVLREFGHKPKFWKNLKKRITTATTTTTHSEGGEGVKRSSCLSI